MKLSETAWQKSSGIIQAAIVHPFNQELMCGVLAADKFSYYIEQDSHFLRDFGKCHAIIASRIKLEYSGIFLQHAQNCFVAEKTIFNKYAVSEKTNLIAPATLSFNSYLLSTCALEPIEVAIAAMLPCFWIYHKVGVFIAEHSDSNNPYATWILSYSNIDFISRVDQMVNIFDDLASGTSEVIRDRMLEAFHTSSCLEWHFWNDAYHKTAFDNIKETV